MLEVRVKSHADEDPNDVGHINTISLVHQTDDIIVLYADLITECKEVTAFGGSSDVGIIAIWLGWDEIQVKLPDEFGPVAIVVETSSYELDICFIAWRLVEAMNNSNDVLWERP